MIELHLATRAKAVGCALVAHMTNHQGWSKTIEEKLPQSGHKAIIWAIKEGIHQASLQQQNLLVFLKPGTVRWALTGKTGTKQLRIEVDKVQKALADTGVKLYFEDPKESPLHIHVQKRIRELVPRSDEIYQYRND